ncbi:hypothetical protein BDV12DRAFT_202645 [Aspergillus spectabilis]
MEIAKDIRDYTRLLLMSASLQYVRKFHLKEMKEKRLLKKCGLGRKDKGPDSCLVPEQYNLTSMGKKRTVKDWTVKLSDRTIGITKRIHQDWQTEYDTSKFKRPLDIFIKSRLSNLLANIQRPLDYNDLPGIRSIHITSEWMLNMPFLSQGRRCRLKGTVEHAVFAGDPDDLNVTMVICRAWKEGQVYVWTLLKMMAIIHHARNKAGKDSEIYGISTDINHWAFAHIDKKSRYSFWFLDWIRDPYEIVTQVERIFQYSIVRAAEASKAGPGEQSTSSVTGCRIYKPEEVVYSKSEEDSDANGGDECA